MAPRSHTDAHSQSSDAPKPISALVDGLAALIPYWKPPENKGTEQLPGSAI